MGEKFHKRIERATCADLSYEGKGVCRIEDGVVFVDFILPGEEGDIEIDYRRNGQLFGHVKKIAVPSPDRISPECPVCYACGGCSFQWYRYEAELRYKQQKIKEQFRKLAGMDVDVLPTVGMEEPRYYRNKIQPLVGNDEEGHTYTGFYKEGTHHIVPVERCLIEDKRASKILKVIRDLLDRFRIPAYDEHARFGVMRRILIKTSYHYPEIMVVLITAAERFPQKDRFVEALIKECPEITTVVQNINNSPSSVILGERERVLFGSGIIRDSIGDLTFRISAKSFYQTNPQTVEILYAKAMEFAHLKPTDVVYDAYSGTGTIGLMAAKHVENVVAVEIVKEAVEDAVRNAQDNHINNYSAHVGDASSFLKAMASCGEKVDVLFMDPPRKGSNPVFMDAVMKMKPSRIVYVSCDPSSLARDVKYLSKLYKVGRIQPIDMFPRTTHVETVAELCLK